MTIHNYLYIYTYIYIYRDIGLISSIHPLQKSQDLSAQELGPAPASSDLVLGLADRPGPAAAPCSRARSAAAGRGGDL